MMQDEDMHEEADGATAPEFSDDAPGFDMLADADTANDAAQEASQDDSYKVLARKYRPRNFDDLIGQEAMVQTLNNAFDTGRIAHAFMLTGVRGVGKTTTARILARALNYHTPTQDAPSMALSEEGTHCAAIMDGSHVDVIEMDAASRTGINDIREIIENVRYAPASARFKVYIIDEVHMLSKAAFNGLLKTLEEPPAHVKFIFATTEIRQVPVTVLSRCQRFDLRRLGHADSEKLLTKVCAAEGVSLPQEALKLIARAADGSARDGLSLLDRALAHTDGTNAEAGKVDGQVDGQADGQATLDENAMRALLGLADRARVFDLFELLMQGQLSAALDEFEAQYAMGADPAVILADLAELTHWLTRLKFVSAAQEDVAFSAELRQRGQAASERLSTRVLSRLWQGLLSGHEEVNRAMNAKAAAEMVLIRLAHLADTPTPDELIAQFDKAPASPTAPASGSGAPSAAPQAQSSPPPPATVHGASAGSNNTRPVMTQAAPVVAAQAPLLQNFQAVIDLAQEKRDIGLKHGLENGVHLVSFETATPERAGRIEIRCVAGEENIVQDLTRKLRDWTGQSWVVSLSQAAGAPTIGSLKRSAAEQREAAAREDPHVKAALAAFPDAEIVSVSEFSEQFDAQAESDAIIDPDEAPDSSTDDA